MIKSLISFVMTVSVACACGVTVADTGVPVITDLKYNEARKLLIQSGWQPAVTIRNNEELTGAAKGFKRIGYNEINDCAETGYSPCLFYFTDVGGKILKVVTRNESSPEEGKFPDVANYSFVNEIPGEDSSRASSNKTSQPATETVKVIAISKADTALGVSLLQCGATFLAMAHNLDDTEKNRLQPLRLEESSKRMVGSATKFVGPNYATLAFPTLLSNASGELKAAYVNGVAGGQKYVDNKLQACVPLYMNNQAHIESAKIQPPDNYPELMLPELREETISKSNVKYKALISCEAGGRNVNVYGCFVNTDLKIKTDTGTQLYQVRDLARAGTMYKEGLLIELPEHFELTAQNSQRNFVLGVLINTLDGKKVFENKAGQYEYISVHN